MLAIGLTLPAGEQLAATQLDNTKRGTVFPASPTHLEVFEIVAGGEHPVGNYAYNSTTSAWVLMSTVAYPYDVGMSVAGKPEANKTVAMLVMVRPTVLNAAFAGSRAACDVTATAAATFVVKLNGVQVGTFVFAPASTTATFTGPAEDLLCGVGDRLTITSPATADATLSYVSATLMGHQLSA